MAEIRIDAAKAERMISQILRDEKGMLSTECECVCSKYLSPASFGGHADADQPAIGWLPDHFETSATR